jgi:glycosyltransferase involved in cell wall biosynthesis
MRVLQFRHLCDTGGVSTVMQLHGRGLDARGIANEYWFCERSSRWPEFEATGRATLGSLGALATRLARGDVDIVHLTSSDPAAPLVARMAAPARVVVTGHGALADWWQRATCFGYTAISEGTARLNQPYTDLHIDVVRNALDADRFAPPAGPASGAPIVAFVGRTTAPEKDFPRFTRIAAPLVAAGWRAWVADPHEGNWDKLLAAGATRLEVERWTRVPSAEMPAFYREVAASGGAVLMTSRSEGFGMVAVEAAASGAFVAAPDQVGFRESVLPGVTGLLFPPDAEDAEVAGRIRAALATPHDGAAAAQAVREAFAPARMTEGYLAVYRDGSRPATADERAEAARDRARELAVLEPHLRQQRTWRARVARREAVELARHGHRRLALGALALTAREDAREFLKGVAVKQVAQAAAFLLRPAARR